MTTQGHAKALFARAYRKWIRVKLKAGRPEKLSRLWDAFVAAGPNGSGVSDDDRMEFATELAAHLFWQQTMISGAGVQMPASIPQTIVQIQLNERVYATALAEEIASVVLEGCAMTDFLAEAGVLTAV